MAAAAEATARGRYDAALASYRSLEQLEPNDGGWSRRRGEVCRQLGRPDEAVDAWTAAAAKYARAGFLVKAIAVYKLILRVDPDNAGARTRLSSLSRERGFSISRPRVKVEINAVPVRGAPLDQMTLADIVPGARPQPTPSGIPSGITIIPIEPEPDEPITIEIAMDDDGPEAARRDALRRTPLFSDLDPASLEALIGRCELVELPPTGTLFRQGDPGNTLYVVAEGSVDVISEGPPRVTLSTLGEGAFFGEIALVTDQVRSATIEAREHTQLIAIARDVVSELLAEHPDVLNVLLRFLRQRLVETLTETSPLFAPFVATERRALASRFELLEVEPETRLVAEGERSPALYIILSGTAEVMREAGGPRRLAALGRGDIFGEVSLLTRQPAIASVWTRTKTWLLGLPAQVFGEVIMTHPQVLMFVGDLADSRQKQLESTLQGGADYTEGRVPLV